MHGFAFEFSVVLLQVMGRSPYFSKVDLLISLALILLNCLLELQVFTFLQLAVFLIGLCDTGPHLIGHSVPILVFYLYFFLQLSQFVELAPCLLRCRVGIKRLLRSLMWHLKGIYLPQTINRALLSHRSWDRSLSDDLLNCVVVFSSSVVLSKFDFLLPLLAYLLQELSSVVLFLCFPFLSVNLARLPEFARWTLVF